VGGPLLVGDLGPRPTEPPLKSGPAQKYSQLNAYYFLDKPEIAIQIYRCANSDLAVFRL